MGTPEREYYFSMHIYIYIDIFAVFLNVIKETLNPGQCHMPKMEVTHVLSKLQQ